MEDGLVAQWLEHYPDKIGVVGSSPTEPTARSAFLVEGESIEQCSR